MKVPIDYMNSGPFFLFLVPVFFFFQGVALDDPLIRYSTYWFLLVCFGWFVKWWSTLHRNQGSFLFAPPPLDWSEQVVLITGGSCRFCYILWSIDDTSQALLASANCWQIRWQYETSQ